MVLEALGFLTGVAAMASGLWLLHRMDSERVMRGISGGRGGRQGA